VDRQYDKKVPFDYVVTQNPRARKRVPRDTAINLVISDGPDPNQPPPEEQTPTTQPTTPVEPGEGATIEGGAKPPPAGEITNDLISRTVNMAKKVPRDHKGPRRVRIEFEDADGKHTAVDEIHDEGDEIKARVTVIGRKLVVRVYYNDDTTPVSEQTSIIPVSP
jgi:beta-lactam-binding protein with PASTA domain